jgi:hypothetical protein
MSPFPHSHSTIRGASGSSTKRDRLSVLVSLMSQGARVSWPRKPVLSLSRRILPLVARILHSLERPSRRRASRGAQDEAEGDSARVQRTSARLDRRGSPGVGSLVRLADERRMRHVDEWRRDDRRRGGDENPEGVGSQARRRRRWASSSTRHNVGSGMKGLIAILGALVALPACAHDQWANGAPVPDWVKASCCGPADAHHLTSDQVHRDGDYYRVDGFLRPIPIAVALPSQDGDYWIFYRDKDGAPGINGGGSGGQSGVYCFFVPMAF